MNVQDRLQAATQFNAPEGRTPAPPQYAPPPAPPQYAPPPAPQGYAPPPAPQGYAPPQGYVVPPPAPVAYWPAPAEASPAPPAEAFPAPPPSDAFPGATFKTRAPAPTVGRRPRRKAGESESEFAARKLTFQAPAGVGIDPAVEGSDADDVDAPIPYALATPDTIPAPTPDDCSPGPITEAIRNLMIAAAAAGFRASVSFSLEGK